METIKISDTKLKVTLSKEDTASFPINEGEMDIASSDVRDALRKLLAEAGRPCGVDISSGRLFIQLYQLPGGGCEMFVTKLDGKTDVETVPNEEEVLSMGPRSIGKAESAERGLRPSRYSVGIYEFESLSPLLTACDRLSKCELVGQSAVYSEDGTSRYFLVLCESGNERTVPELTDAILYEYGGKRRKSGSYAYIKEHCSAVCDKDAVKWLGALS